MKSQTLRIALVLAGAIAFGAFSIHGFIGLVRQTHTRGVEREVSAAVLDLQRSPPGIDRAERFVQSLKRIDPGYAPEEVKRCLKDYIAALEQASAEIRAGRDTLSLDDKIARSRANLIEAVKKYE
jgi:hypothetical protein